MAKQDDKGAPALPQLSDIDPAVLKLARVTSELPDIKRRYIMSLVDAMAAGDDSVGENIRRHLAGERVTTGYPECGNRRIGARTHR